MLFYYITVNGHAKKTQSNHNYLDRVTSLCLIRPCPPTQPKRDEENRHVCDLSIKITRNFGLYLT